MIRAADDLVMPTIQQISIGVERPLFLGVNFRSDYLRLRGTHTLRSINANVPVDGARPDPDFGNITQIVSAGASHTDRLTVGVQVMMPGRIRTSATYQLGAVEELRRHAAQPAVEQRIDDNGDAVFNDRPVGVGRNGARGAGTWNASVRVSRSFGFGGPASDPAGPGGLGGAGGGPMARRLEVGATFAF